eukprot:gnl/TRDRNA2_/TRDRNA2_162990_c2_seq1.p1 gnl/TRDRNA2_/TRDRNA2_162990_c2~~gnl/TRDRNA2_/TRDRNA2_162990_c2_seq1.p1  ORF type:complete len:465 (+),score=65.69 gnl/TRDRNA2_/TRDRNA2_162990_c2_seq1:63-1397(+)
MAARGMQPHQRWVLARRASLRTLCTSQKRTGQLARQWNVQSGPVAAAIQNPIRKIMDTIAGKENPNKRLISLAQGDPTVYPHLNPSDSMVMAVNDLLKGGRANGYQPSQGNGKTRETIADIFSVDARPPLKAEDIFMTHGCSEALSHCIAALATKGSNMLLPRPGFPLCEILCDYYGVEPRYYDLDPETGWEIDINSFRERADENTCALVINNPSNPCGSVYSFEHLEKVLEAAEELCLPIIADEVYFEMSFKRPYVPCAQVNPRVPILSTSALSKRWLAPGWRVGWVTVYDANGIFRAAEVQDTLLKICQVSLGPAAPLQAAIPAIMQRGPQEEKWKRNILASLEESARYCMHRCMSVPGLEVASEPQGAMYIMVKINSDSLNGIDDAVSFAGALLEEESIAVLPGECFACPGFFRIVFCGTLPVLKEAWDRIEAFCRRRYIK